MKKIIIKSLFAWIMVIFIAIALVGCAKKTEPAQMKTDTTNTANIANKADTANAVESNTQTKADIAAEGGAQVKTDTAESTRAESSKKPAINEAGSYYDVENVVLYLHTYGRLPRNYITKKEAKELGWEGGSVEAVAPDKAIGGDHYGNYEGKLPEVSGREYHECDIDTHGYKNRGSRRLIYSNDGAYYYTDDHYESFRELYVTDEGAVKWK